MDGDAQITRRPPEPRPTAPGPSDTALVRAATLGDRDAFETIVARHGPAMHRYARRMVLDHGEAQDVVQETFIAAWKSLDRFSHRSSLSTWLFGITAHKSADALRRRRPQPIDSEVLLRDRATIDGDPEAESERREFLKALNEALGHLPERQRSCWLLTQVEGLTQAETAVALGISPDAVRGQLFRARQALIERMEPWR